MNEAIYKEFIFFGTSIVWGILLLIFYDILRIIRRLISHNGFFIAVEDLIYWVISSLLIFQMMYKQNNGIIRGFSIMAMLLGMLIYHEAISDYLVDLITGLFERIIYFIVTIIKFLLRPFHFLFHMINKLFVQIIKLLKKIKQVLRKILKKFSKPSKITISDNEKGD